LRINRTLAAHCFPLIILCPHPAEAEKLYRALAAAGEKNRVGMDSARSSRKEGSRCC